MKPTIDMRRRKSPLTFDRILHLHRRTQLRTGQRETRLLLRMDQQREFYGMLKSQASATAADSPFNDSLRWNSLEVIARG